MERILITGASGLLGSQLVPLLRTETEVDVYRGDLAVGVDAGLLPPRLDAVVHLAQSRRFRDFPDAAAEVARVNTLAAVELAEHAVRAGATHFVYASTGGVYATGPEPLAETAPLADAATMGFYAATKLAAERLLAPFASQLNVVILRPFFIYGRGQDRSMLIPRLVDSVKSGAAIGLAGSDGISINPVHVSDAAAAARAALRLDGSHTINVAGPETLTLREIAEEIGRQAGRAATFEKTQGAVPADLVGDTALMARLLVRPGARFVDRLAELVE